MKRQLAIALGLAVVSGSALASKARLEALGQDANGSMVIDDHRSIFLNAAHLNHHKDFATFEFGDTAENLDARTTPRAEGGVIKSSGNMVYGLYFGEEANSANAIRGTVNEEMNNTTVFFGGDAGVQWGASILFGQYEDKQVANDVKASQTRARFGVISGNIDAFLNMGIANTAEVDGGAEFEGKSSMDLGVTYNMGDVNYMVRSSSFESEEKNSGDAVKYNRMMVGASKEYKLNDKAMMWASAWYSTAKYECDTTFIAFCGGGDESTTTALPVSIALEATATDWLALRASVSQNVFINENDNGSDKKTNDDTTTTAIGASFTYGDLSVDAMVGASGEDTQTTGQFGTNEMLHRLSMTYNF